MTSRTNHKQVFSFCLLSFVILLLTLQACKKEQDQPDDSVSPVTETGLPSEAVVGETITFPIKHFGYNGCAQYSRTETKEEGNTITVTQYVQYKGQICTMHLPGFVTPYTFTPKRAGTYIFQFRQEDTFLVDTLLVK